MATILGPQVPGAAFQGPLYHAYRGPTTDGAFQADYLAHPPLPLWAGGAHRWSPDYAPFGVAYLGPCRLPGMAARLPVPYYHSQVYTPSPPPRPFPYPRSPILPSPVQWPLRHGGSPDSHGGSRLGYIGRAWSPGGVSRRRVSRRTKSDMSRGGWARGGAGSRLGSPALQAVQLDGHARRNSWAGGADAGNRVNSTRNGRSAGARSPCNTRNGDGRLQRLAKPAKQSKQQIGAGARSGAWRATATPALPFTSKRPADVRRRRSSTPDEDAIPAKALNAYSEVADGALELRPARGPVARGRAGRAVAQPHCLRMALALARGGLDKGYMPELTGNGTGGAYFIRAKSGDAVAVFKPRDEEPCASNNPRGLAVGAAPGEGLKRGIRPGEGAAREVAAYLLDHEHFAGVPPTQLVCCRSRNKVSQESRLGRAGEGGVSKVGSLQKFVASDADCEEMGPAAFSAHQVHKICVLDMRLANADRNGSNILACRMEEGWELTPIDHGYCLPDTFQDLCFEWKYWKQAKVPFDEATLKYIAQLDAKEDIRTLEQHGIVLREGCRRVFRACNSLLKKAAARGLTPFQIANLMCREALEPSPLEKMFEAALGTFRVEAVEEDVLMAAVDKRIDRYLAALSGKARKEGCLRGRRLLAPSLKQAHLNDGSSLGRW